MRNLLGLLLALLFVQPAPATTLPGHFPPSFRWGTATAAVQVEGGSTHSDWAAFERRPGAIRDGQRIGDAAKHWEKYEEDFRAAQAMHSNAYRFSLEWSRLEPRRGVWDEAAAAHYRAMLLSLREKHIRPLVTLHHFSNPQWVADQGGWLNPRTGEDFAAFAGRAAAAYGDLVDDWITFNEPTVYAGEGYIRGVFPPGRQGEFGRLPEVEANLAIAHGRAYHAIHDRDRVPADPRGPAARVGLAEHLVHFEPANPLNPLDAGVALVSESWMNDSFLDAVSSGHLRFFTWAGIVDRWEPGLAGCLDFVGVNYYTRSLACFTSPITRGRAMGECTDLGLEVYPDGLYDVIVRAWGRYHKPIMVTETGIADAGRRATPRFMVRHLARVARAIADGVPVEGVYWWSLLDNFEWQNGYTGRFGLLAVDFDRPDRPRTWTPAAYLYARVARENGLSDAMLAQYGDPPAAAAGLPSQLGAGSGGGAGGVGPTIVRPSGSPPIRPPKVSPPIRPPATFPPARGEGKTLLQKTRPFPSGGGEGAQRADGGARQRMPDREPPG